MGSWEGVMGGQLLRGLRVLNRRPWTFLLHPRSDDHIRGHPRSIKGLRRRKLERKKHKNTQYESVEGVMAIILVVRKDCD